MWRIEPAAAAAFWGQALGAAQRPADGGALVEAGFVELFFHPADAEQTPSDEEKNPRGGSTVAYLADALAIRYERRLQVAFWSISVLGFVATSFFAWALLKVLEIYPAAKI